MNNQAGAQVDVKCIAAWWILIFMRRDGRDGRADQVREGGGGGGLARPQHRGGDQFEDAGGDLDLGRVRQSHSAPRNHQCVVGATGSGQINLSADPGFLLVCLGREPH
jgi:hypothetical protein